MGRLSLLTEQRPTVTVAALHSNTQYLLTTITAFIYSAEIILTKTVSIRLFLSECSEHTRNVPHVDYEQFDQTWRKCQQHDHLL